MFIKPHIMEDLRQKSLAQILRKNIHTAPVFEEYGIDFCCQGKNKLEELCVKKNIDILSLLDKLKHVRWDQSGIDINFNTLEIDELCDYIVDKHHSYVKQSLPTIQNHLIKVSDIHAEKHPELKQVLHYFTELCKTLEPHIRKEEYILFPYIKTLCKTIKGTAEKTSITSLIQIPIHILEKEHENTAEYMRDIKALTCNYTLPPDASMTYKLVYKELDAFEKDLHIHLHLENNVLFPKVIVLEKKLTRTETKQ